MQGHLEKQTKVVTQSIKIKKLLLTCLNQVRFKTTASHHRVVAVKYRIKKHSHFISTSMMLPSETKKKVQAFILSIKKDENGMLHNRSNHHNSNY